MLRDHIKFSIFVSIRFFSHAQNETSRTLSYSSSPSPIFFCNKARCTLAHMYIKAAPFDILCEQSFHVFHLNTCTFQLNTCNSAFTVHRVQKLHNVPICSHQFFYYFSKKNVTKKKNPKKKNHYVNIIIIILLSPTYT